MRLSDAIALGRLVIKPYRGSFIRRDGDDNDQGCALGMALVAVMNVRDFINDPASAALKQWPWLVRRFSLPCRTMQFDNLGRPNGQWCVKAESLDARFPEQALSGIACITHLFDAHHGQDWTLDQLIEWVRSVEPAPGREQAGDDRRLAVTWRHEDDQPDAG